MHKLDASLPRPDIVECEEKLISQGVEEIFTCRAISFNNKSPTWYALTREESDSIVQILHPSLEVHISDEYDPHAVEYMSSYINVHVDQQHIFSKIRKRCRFADSAVNAEGFLAIPHLIGGTPVDSPKMPVGTKKSYSKTIMRGAQKAIMIFKTQE